MSKNGKIFVKCPRCGTKKKLASNTLLGTKVKCICGNIYVGLSRKKGSHSLPQLSDSFYNKPMKVRRQRRGSPKFSQKKVTGWKRPTVGWKKRSTSPVRTVSARSHFPSVTEVTTRLMLSKNRNKGVQSWHAKKTYEGADAVKSFFDMYKTSSAGQRNRQSKTIRHARSEYATDDHQGLSPRSAYIEKLDMLKLPPELLFIVRKKNKQHKIKQVISPLDGSTINTSVLSDRVNMGNFSLGDLRLEAVFTSLKLTEFKSVDISGNRLTDKGAKSVFKCFSTQCSEFDLSHNRIGLGGIQSFSSYVIRSIDIVVCELNLEDNQLRDQGALVLAEAFGHPSVLYALKRLNVNKNKITDVGGVPLVKALEKHESLVELSFSWNPLRVALALVPSSLKYLQHLDAAWTSLGTTTPVTIPFENVPPEAIANPFSVLCSSLGRNKVLLHLDLRFNKFSPQQINELGMNLVSNNTLIGLHVTGPEDTYLDGHGFLYCLKPTAIDPTQLPPGAAAGVGTPRTPPPASDDDDDDEDTPRPDPAILAAKAKSENMFRTFKKILTRHENDNVSNTISDTGEALHLGDEADSHFPWMDKPHTRARVGQQKGCWICEQWSEVKIVCDVEMAADPAIYVAAKKRGVNLHLSIDGFRGEAMVRKKDNEWRKDNKVKRWCSYRMMPPGTVFFFFSVPIQVNTTVDPNNKVEGEEAKPVDTLKKFTLDKRYKKRKWSVWIKSSMTFFAPPVPDSISGRQAKTYSDLQVVNYVKVRARVEPLTCRRTQPRFISDGQLGKTIQSWNMEFSVYADRLRTSDARGFYNTDRVFQRMLVNDYKYSKCSKFLDKFYANMDKDKEKKQRIATAKAELLQRGETCYRYCVDCFKVGCSNYCGLRHDPKTFKKNGFTTLVQRAGLLESARVLLGEGKGYIQTKAMTLPELDMIFLKTNLEDDTADNKKQELMNDINPDNAINRFEWLEALCHIAVHRYGLDRPKGKNPRKDRETLENQLTIGAAVELCIHEASQNLEVNHLFHQSDDFRRQYLYNEDMDIMFKFMEDRLRRFYNFAAGRSSTDAVGKLGYDPGWLDVFTRMSNNLVHTSTTKGPLEALKIRYAFIYSHMATVTLLDTPGKDATMEFCDFIEGLARIAFEVYPPHVIDRPLAVGVGRLLAYHFVDVCTEHGKEGKLAQRAEQYLAIYDKPAKKDKDEGNQQSESDSETETKAIDETDHGIVTSAMKNAVAFMGDSNKDDSDDDIFL